MSSKRSNGSSGVGEELGMVQYWELEKLYENLSVVDKRGPGSLVLSIETDTNRNFKNNEIIWSLIGSKQTVLVRCGSWVLLFVGINVGKGLSMYISQGERGYGK